MKKILLFSLVATLSLTTLAQNKETENASNEKTSWSGFVTNRFWDNWFISVGAGGQIYFGEYDSKTDFGKRLTPAFDLSVGKWFMPTLGARAQVGGFTLRGSAGDASNIYQKGIRNNGYYRQNWKQFNVHVDGLINLSNWIGGYRTDRFYEAVPFAGFGMIHGCSSADNTAFMFTAGILNKMRLCDAIDLNIELKGKLVPQDFDGEVGGSRGEGILSLTAGITYKFNQRKFRKEQKTKIVPTGISQEDYINVKNLLQAEQQKASQLQRELEQSKKELEASQKDAQKDPLATKLTVFFEINKAVLDDKGKLNIRNYAEVIKNAPDKKFLVTGYADKATGTAKFNQKLSEKRAQRVADVLVKEFGVKKEQLIVSGKGGVDTEKAKLCRSVVIELAK